MRIQRTHNVNRPGLARRALTKEIARQQIDKRLGKRERPDTDDLDEELDHNPLTNAGVKPK